MAFEKGNPKNASQQDTATGSAPDPIFAQPRDSSQEQAWSGAHPLASASWDSSVSDLLAGQGDVTGDAIIRLFTEQAQMIKEKFDVQIVAHQTSRDNFRIGWSGVAIIAKKVINNTSFASTLSSQYKKKPEENDVLLITFLAIIATPDQPMRKLSRDV
jgi:hypothetical protein